MADGGGDGPQPVVLTPLETYFRWTTTALLFILRPIGIALYYIATYLFFTVVFVLNLIYQPLAFLLQPVFYLCYFILDIVAIPFRLVTKFETLYIYLAIAALVGVTGGLAMSYISGRLLRVLQLDTSTEPPIRSVRQYRQGKQKEKTSSAGPMLSASGLMNGYSTSSDGGGRSRKARSLMAQTILEEDDSDF